MNSNPSALLGLLLSAGLFGTPRPAFALDEAPAPRPVGFAVEKHKNIVYRAGPDSEKERHTLDVYVPKGKKDFPVVLFVHGGAWKWGDKSLYAGIGDAFAARGIGMVICNYRLSPKVQHPAHVEDVAAAFAWTADNIAKYSGNVKELFVCGHSAGGHLVSLVATDPSYLKAEKHSPTEIAGVISISGVYKIYHTEKVFLEPFGKDETICLKASPLTHVAGKHPPFLIVYADKDYEHLDEMAKDMDAALKKVASPCDLMICKDRSHISIIVNLVQSDDPLHQSICEFVTRHAK
ncbi:MAG: alpha/beta hydrolase [Planctomycetes bacterium]|nr:alpha/beta hydrolase [Planctomycetota bacterium]